MSKRIEVHIRGFIRELYAAWLAERRQPNRLQSPPLLERARSIITRRGVEPQSVGGDLLERAYEVVRHNTASATSVAYFERCHSLEKVAEAQLTLDARRRLQIWHSLQSTTEPKIGRKAAVKTGKPSKQSEWQRVVSHSLGSVELHEEVLNAVRNYFPTEVRPTTDDLALLLALEQAVFAIEHELRGESLTGRKQQPPLTFEATRLAKIAAIATLYRDCETLFGRWLYQVAAARRDLASRLDDLQLRLIMNQLLDGGLEFALGNEAAVNVLQRIRHQPPHLQAEWLADSWNRYQELVYIAMEAVEVA